MVRETNRDAKPLWLTREEAFGLLGLSIASMADHGEAEEQALLKLGELCRAFFRDEGEPASGEEQTTAPAPCPAWASAGALSRRAQGVRRLLRRPMPPPRRGCARGC